MFWICSVGIFSLLWPVRLLFCAFSEMNAWLNGMGSASGALATLCYKLCRFANDIARMQIQMNPKSYGEPPIYMYIEGINRLQRNNGDDGTTEFNRKSISIAGLLYSTTEQNKQQQQQQKVHREQKNGRATVKHNNGSADFARSPRHSREIIIYWNSHVTMTWRLMFFDHLFYEHARRKWLMM